MNNRALNRAWVIKWKKARLGEFILNLAIITPSCLRVDKAMIFFKSHSVIAESPAISIVRQEINRRVDISRGTAMIELWKRIRRKTPAVTRVEECTKADTGVGAAIAAGSHLENGIWALFVRAAIKIEREIIFLIWLSHTLRMDHWLVLRVQPMAKSNVISPIRFVKAVIMPAPSEEAFW